MKLKDVEKKSLNTYSFSYSKILLIAFAFLYFILPIFLQKIVGSDFYIYSQYQTISNIYSILFFFLVLFLILYTTNIVKRRIWVRGAIPSMENFRFFYWMNIIYLIIIIIKGVTLRFNGTSRLDLLASISSQLIPGYGYILLLSCISVFFINKRSYLILFLVLSFFIDLIYQGKIFSTNSLMLLMFFLDINHTRISFKRLCIIAISGVLFLFLIFAIRALASGDNLFMSVYSFSSEFMGVNATTGWGYDYFASNMPMKLNDFDGALRDYYIENVGHGLALSPIAYFIANFGSYSLMISTLYILFLILLCFLFSFWIGRFVLYVLMYDFIHLLRHGPDLFLEKMMLHMLFLLLLFVALRNVSFIEKKYNKKVFF